MSSIFRSKRENKVYYSPTPGKITLVAGRPNANNGQLTQDLCQELKKCGFNATAATLGFSEIAASLNNCYDNDIKLLLYNGYVLENAAGFARQFKGYRGLGGWILTFNTQGIDIENTSLKNFPQLNQNIYEEDPTHPIFIGLSGDWDYPSNVGEGGVKGLEFPDYIEKYQLEYQPSFWPYAFLPDISPINANGSEIDKDRINMFYKSLQYFAYISRYTATPFWCYCRCQNFSNFYGMDGGYPNERLIRGIVFSSLAYGAQGIYYWNYRGNTIKDQQSSSVVEAPVNSNGDKTIIWDMVRNVNKEVDVLNEVFCGCEMLDCRHFNYKYPDKFIKKWEYPMGPLMTITPSKNSNDLGLLVSQINNNGKNYIVIVADPFDSMNVYSSFTFEMSTYWKTYLIEIENSEMKTKELQVSNVNPQSFVITKDLKPGDYMILEWK